MRNTHIELARPDDAKAVRSLITDLRDRRPQPQGYRTISGDEHRRIIAYLDELADAYEFGGLSVASNRCRGCGQRFEVRTSEIAETINDTPDDGRDFDSIHDVANGIDFCRTCAGIEEPTVPTRRFGFKHGGVIYLSDRYGRVIDEIVNRRANRYEGRTIAPEPMVETAPKPDLIKILMGDGFKVVDLDEE